MAGRALLVGINDYAPAGAGGPDLHGCVNDVRDAATTLVNLGLVAPAPPTLRILTDARATRANITTGLAWLLTRTPGIDRMIFYYSGHGSYVVDTNGEETDRRDEAIVPYDFATAGLLTDDEFRRQFGAVPPGVTLEVILDSCFSGTATRMVRALESLPDQDRFSIRFIEPPLDYAFFADAHPTMATRRFMQVPTDRAAVPVPGLNHILWAACRADQTAGEAPIGGVVRGAFSYCFFKALRNTQAHVPRRRLEAVVSAEVARLGFSQVPQLEATAAELGDVVFRETMMPVPAHV